MTKPRIVQVLSENDTRNKREEEGKKEKKENPAKNLDRNEETRIATDLSE